MTLRSTAMKMKIPMNKIIDFIKDIKRLNIRHKPFSAWVPHGYYEIELYPNPNNDLLYLKYCT
jgi:predicted RNase H-like nuclease